MPVADVEIVEKMAKRVADIEAFLRDNQSILEPQKHTDVFSSERVYWHAGYASALKDVLNALQGTRRSPFN